MDNSNPAQSTSQPTTVSKMDDSNAADSNSQPTTVSKMDNSNPAESTSQPTTVSALEPSPPTNAEWLKPFVDNKRSGLPVFIKEVTKYPNADVVTKFRNCLVDVKAELESKGETFADQLGFLEQYDQLQQLKTQKEALPADIAQKQSALEWNFHQCAKAMFFIGHFTVPAMHFCGSVQPELMAEDERFHGYNER